MVNHSSDPLDALFGALADPTRRSILERLEREGGQSVSRLAAPFDLKLNSVMKHLDVLSHAGLVAREKHGRTVEVRLAAGRLKGARDWLDRYERHWMGALDRLGAYAEEMDGAMDGSVGAQEQENGR